MATIKSTVKKLDDLIIYELASSRVLNCEKVINVGGLLVFLGKNGKLYCNRLNNYCYLPGEYPWMSSLMIALLKIGYIDDAQFAEHTKLCAEAAKRDRERYAKQEIAGVIERHGKEFIEAQLKEAKK